MTVLEFATTATETRLIASRFGKRFLQLRVFGCQHKHHLCGRAIAPQQLGHDAHRLVDMEEERLVASTQVIQSRLAIGCLNEAVLGAFAIACKAYLAPAAVARQLSIERLKKSSPIKVGSPPCQDIVTSGAR